MFIEIQIFSTWQHGILKIKKNPQQVFVVSAMEI